MDERVSYSTIGNVIRVYVRREREARESARANSANIAEMNYFQAKAEAYRNAADILRRFTGMED